MEKKSKKILSLLQINILVISIISLAFLANISQVSATVFWLDSNNIVQSGDKAPTGVDIYKTLEEASKAASGGTNLQDVPSSTFTPSSSSSASKWLGITPASSATEKASEFFSAQTGGGVDAIISGAQYAFVAWSAVKGFSGMFGLSQTASDSLANSAFAGAFAFKTASVLF